MYFLAGSLVLLAVTALVRGETCAGITNCLNHARSIQAAAESGNMAQMCSTQKKMVDCFSSALADCQNSRSDFPQSSLEQFRTSMTQARQQYEKACGDHDSSAGSSSSGGDTGTDGMKYGGSDSGSIPENPSCLEATKCSFNAMKLNEAVNENRYKEACSMLAPAEKCMRMAYEDCKKNNLFPEEQLNAMYNQVNEVKSLSDQHCGGGASGIGVSAVFMTLISALALLVARLF